MRHMLVRSRTTTRRLLGKKKNRTEEDLPSELLGCLFLEDQRDVVLS